MRVHLTGRSRFMALGRAAGEPSTAPTFSGIDPSSMTDRNDTTNFGVDGENLDNGTAMVEDDEGPPGGLVIDNILVNTNQNVSFDATSEDGVTTLGTHTLTFTNDGGSFQFQIEVEDA